MNNTHLYGIVCGVPLKRGTRTNGNKGMRSCTHPMGICRCHVLTDITNLRDSNASRTKRLSNAFSIYAHPHRCFTAKLPYNFFPCLHMKKPLSAWNVNAKIGINIIKPETSGNKPMFQDLKNKIVQKRRARKREQDTSFRKA